jgi:GAF domain-containing protein
MSNLTTALAQKNQPEATFQALEQLVNETIGVTLFTLMEIDHIKGVARRNYTNMPDAYPVSGEKPMQHDRWSEQVEGAHQTFVANSIEEIADVFPDYELIQSLGCESCMNVPIVVGGKVLGTLNCLNVAGHFTPERVHAAEGLKEAGAIAFLLNENTKRKG